MRRAEALAFAFRCEICFVTASLVTKFDFIFGQNKPGPVYLGISCGAAQDRANILTICQMSLGSATHHDEHEQRPGDGLNAKRSRPFLRSA